MLSLQAINPVIKVANVVPLKAFSRSQPNRDNGANGGQRLDADATIGGSLLACKESWIAERGVSFAPLRHRGGHYGLKNRSCSDGVIDLRHLDPV